MIDAFNVRVECECRHLIDVTRHLTALAVPRLDLVGVISKKQYLIRAGSDTQKPVV